jgi:hypothetical protein
MHREKTGGDGRKDSQNEVAAVRHEDAMAIRAWGFYIAAQRGGRGWRWKPRHEERV